VTSAPCVGRRPSGAGAEAGSDAEKSLTNPAGFVSQVPDDGVALAAQLLVRCGQVRGGRLDPFDAREKGESPLRGTMMKTNVPGWRAWRIRPTT